MKTGIIIFLTFYGGMFMGMHFCFVKGISSWSEFKEWLTDDKDDE